jgi:hypothetical protein
VRVLHRNQWIPVGDVTPKTLTARLENTKDLVTGNKSHLGDAVRITEGNTDLGWGQTLTGELADVLNNIIGGGLEPRRGCTAIWKCGGRYRGWLARDCIIKSARDQYQCPFPERAYDPW